MLNSQKTNRYEICVGYNDADTKEQKFSKDIYEKIIINVCRGYKISYSINQMSGGYIHDDGTFVKENSACILLIGATDKLVEEIAKDLCAFFNQESVMVVKSDAECCFISEKI